MLSLVIQKFKNTYLNFERGHFKRRLSSPLTNLVEEEICKFPLVARNFQVVPDKQRDWKFPAIAAIQSCKTGLIQIEAEIFPAIVHDCFVSRVNAISENPVFSLFKKAELQSILT